MIKILVEGMTEGKGGKEAYIMNTFRAFNKEKYAFSFLSYNDRIAYQDEIEAAGCEIIRVPARHEGLFAFRHALNELMSERNFDVVWANKTTLSSCEVLEIAKKYNVPLRIAHSHSSSNMGGNLTLVLHTINKILIKKWANEYFACSDKAARWFFGNKPYVLAKNGIDVERFRFNEDARKKIRNALALNGMFVIGHVGRFSKEKNHKKLINVFNVVHRLNNKTKLVLCGDGAERGNIEKQIDMLGLKETILLLGNVDNVEEVLQGIDVVVMPSLFEGLPFALLEAQSAGLKCIVSDTISDESDVLGRNRVVPLEGSDQEWASAILDTEIKTESRGIAADQMRDCGYDINQCIQQIETIISKYIN